mmetsp:Transcript_1432/g.4904  ORF Transcript_1432/g.4904 Transcript_1432/m.4904 type:complete len:83 (-) Transcript_1432:789-1037(-)
MSAVSRCHSFQQDQSQSRWLRRQNHSNWHIQCMLQCLKLNPTFLFGAVLHLVYISLSISSSLNVAQYCTDITLLDTFLNSPQ